MSARDDLLAALAAERYDNGWWTTPERPDEDADNDLATARRRRLLAADFEQLREDSA